jgi:hypothetical protein
MFLKTWVDTQRTTRRHIPEDGTVLTTFCLRYGRYQNHHTGNTNVHSGIFFRKVAYTRCDVQSEMIQTHNTCE